MKLILPIAIHTYTIKYYIFTNQMAVVQIIKRKKIMFYVIYVQLIRSTTLKKLKKV